MFIHLMQLIVHVQTRLVQFPIEPKTTLSERSSIFSNISKSFKTDVSNPVVLLLLGLSQCFTHAHHELRVQRVEEGPRGALRASQKHSGLLAFHSKRNVAAAG